MFACVTPSGNKWPVEVSRWLEKLVLVIDKHRLCALLGPTDCVRLQKAS